MTAGRRSLCIAVTGLNATDNPAPGVGVIRALRDARPKDHYVGLAYDALDPGIYAQDLVRDVFLLPYPSQGLDPLIARLEYVHERVGLDVIIPTLDAELPAFIEAAPRLQELGISTFLPTREQLELRGKGQLAALGVRAGISVPATAVVTTAAELAHVHQQVPYPMFVKGLFYGATLAHNLEEAVTAFHKIVAQWGVPIIVQSLVPGEEVNVVAVGDGRGHLVGAVAMKKLLITDKGKGWAGVTIRDPSLLDLTRAFMAATSWRGPCEIEAIRDRHGRYHLIEINPRFPAWVYLASAAGVNLPRAVAELAMGRRLSPLSDYAAGKLFVRISIDQIATLDDFQRVMVTGELSRIPEAVNPLEPLNEIAIGQPAQPPAKSPAKLAAKSAAKSRSKSAAKLAAKSARRPSGGLSDGRPSGMSSAISEGASP